MGSDADNRERKRKPDQQMATFKRRMQMRYLQNKLRTYSRWAAVVPLRWKEPSAEALYHEYRQLYAEMDREEFKEREKHSPPHFEIPKQQQQQREPWQRMIAEPLWALLDQVVPNCVYLNDLHQDIITRHMQDTSDVGGGSTCPIVVTDRAGTQRTLDVNLYDVAKWWRPDEIDIAYADVELKLNLPAAPCDGFYMWFTVVHLWASTWFGDADYGASNVSFAYRTDMGPIADSAPFAIPGLTPYVQFNGPDTDLVPAGAIEINGTGTWESSFDVSAVIPIQAGQAPVVRFYTRGIASALDGRCHLVFGIGVFDSWAIHAGSGFNDTVRGVRYMTFPPSGLGAP